MDPRERKLRPVAGEDPAHRHGLPRPQQESRPSHQRLAPHSPAFGIPGRVTLGKGLPLDAPAAQVVDALAGRTSLGPDEARRAALDPVTTDDELVAVAALLARAREEITRGTRDHQPA